MARTAETYQEAIRLYVETTGDKQVGELAAQLGKLAQGADAGAEQAQQLVGELERLASVSNAMRSFPALKAQLTETGTALGHAKDRAAALRAEFDAADQPTKRLQQSLSRAEAGVDRLTRQQGRQQAELTRTSQTLRAAGVDTDHLAQAYSHLQDEFGRFGSKAAVAAAAADRTGKAGRDAAGGLTAMEKASKGAGEQLASVGAKLTAVSAAATAAVAAMAAAGGAALFTGAIRSATTLEDALSQVRAVSGATAEEMKALQAAAEEGGRSTRFTTLEAAQGLGELARATGSAKEAIAGLPAVLNLAQASGIGVAEAATLVTTSLTNFGLGGEHAARVADVMAREVNSTQDSMDKLGNALSYTAPLANQLGLTLEDTVAIIGALAEEGYKSERAGTAMRAMMIELLNPASDFSRALRDIGIESTDFVTVIEQLAAKGNLGRDALLKLGSEAYPAISALVTKGGAGIRQLQADLQGANGEAARTAKIMGENLSGAAESISDSFDRTRRALVEPLLDPLRKELLGLSAELETFAKSDDFAVIRDSLKTLFVEGAQAARELIENTDFQVLAQNIRDFATDADGSLTEFKESLGTIATAVKVIGATVSVVFNGIQTVILGAAAAVTAVAEGMAKNIDRLIGSKIKLMQFIGVLEDGPTALEEFVGGMQAVTDEFSRRAAKNAEETAEAFQNIGDVVSGAADKAAASTETVSKANEQASKSAKAVGESATGAADGLDKQGKAAEGAAEKTGKAAAQMDADAARLKKAFADLGVASQADLTRSAEAAKRNFELIRQAAASGSATAEDARRAYAAYAEAARAAAADSDATTRTRVESELQVQAAILGVNAALDQQRDKGLSAGNGIAEGARNAGAALTQTADAAGAAASGVQTAGDESQKAGDKMAKGAEQARSFGLTMSSVSDEFNRAAAAINKYAGTRLWAEMLNDVTARHTEQAKAVQDEMAALDAELAKYDEMSEAVEQLRAQYNYLGDDQLRALAEKRKQLADMEKREREAAAQARQEQQRAASASEGPGAVQVAKADTAGAAKAVDEMLGRVQQAAASLSTAASRVQGATSGEVVIRIVSEAAPGAVPLRLNDAQTREIASAVVRELKRAKGNST